MARRGSRPPEGGRAEGKTGGAAKAAGKAPVAKGRAPRRPRAVPGVDQFERRLGHQFRAREGLEAAWVHRSAANERKLAANYERLEFLGDAVLGLIAADWLYRSHPDLPEGELSRRKSALVSADVLASYARALGLGAHLVIGQGEERSGGRDKTSLLADSLEAVIAAVYLDGGLRAAKKVVEKFLRASSASLDYATADAKSDLQERLQGRGGDAPVYRVSDQSGPDHDKTFTVEVVIDGEVAGRGSGRSKKAAELDAARRALEGRWREHDQGTESP